MYLRDIERVVTVLAMVRGTAFRPPFYQADIDPV